MLKVGLRGDDQKDGLYDCEVTARREFPPDLGRHAKSTTSPHLINTH